MSKASSSPSRREVIAAGFAGAASLLPNPLAAQNKIDPEKGVTAPEDLMKEHGVLNRCLLIYEEAIRRIRVKQEVHPEVFNHTAALIRKFVEEYHEQNEEKFIFPVFKKAKKMLDLVH